MAKVTRTIQGFRADLLEHKKKFMPQTFVTFQKWIAIELYKRIMQKTPVDEGILRGSWTISVGAQDRTPANAKSDAKEFDSAYGGAALTSAERANFKAAIAGMNQLGIGQVVWINNAMPYVEVIEFDGHSSVKAPAGMVQISIAELKVWLSTKYSEYIKLSEAEAL